MQVSTTRKTLSHLTSALRQARDGEDLASFWQDVYNYLLTADVPLSTHYKVFSPKHQNLYCQLI